MKKYELTQEQINQLAEKKHAKELLKEFIPEAFENELEVGKWYKSKLPRNKTLFVPNKEQCDSNMGYGFNYLGEFKESHFNLLGCTPNKFELATEEEVVKALINEAIKRGYKKGVKCKFGTSKEIRTIETNNFFFEFNLNKLYLRHSSGDNADEIFRNGFWAEIIKEEKPTQEEIDRVINYLKNK